MISLLTVLSVAVGVPTAVACGSMVFAARSAPRTRQGRMRTSHLTAGAVLSAGGLAVLALTAWSTHEDQHYDDFGSAMTDLAATLAGAVVVLGLGPYVAWLLAALGRDAVRLPPAFRLAARNMADRSRRTAPVVAAIMCATAVAVAVMTTGSAMTAQERARYVPEALPGALVVKGFPADQAATVRAAVERELPGVPITQNSRRRGPGWIGVAIPSLSTWANPYIGDETLLRYLTGGRPVPYDEGRVVVIAPDDEVIRSVEIEYTVTFTPSEDRPVTTIPAITVRPAGRGISGVFVPAQVVSDLGLQLEPDQLIIDPALHRTTAAEQERLDRRLGESAGTYIERGYRPSSWRLYVVAAMALVAVVGALATIRLADARRTLLRLGGGSATTLRLLVVCRAAYSAICGTVLGVAAGLVIGLLLAWPMTVSIDWDPLPRTSFDTPWTAIAAFAAGVPVLTAAIAGLASQRRLTRSRDR